MASKLQFQIKADKVNIEVLWQALTKDKFEVIEKAAPGLLSESHILEDNGHGYIVLGSIVHVSFGPDRPNLTPLKEKVVELDEANHVLSFQGIEGGFMKPAFACLVTSFKLDCIGEGNTMISTTVTYDLEKNIDGTEVLEELSKMLKHYLNCVVSYLQKNNA
ncbi:phytohormone-binding protein-like [Phalaenopsis equestris]|uniref:phytohormone-binding protein-like n=1 Tax=Phalaenopsis equestris TaxID=78828 RepID=UPI0009E1FB15|nr:phytohormone-binding protein-like [Phalaenopsis equestris]